MFLVRMTVAKDKGDHESSVEIPSFFRYDDDVEEVRKYIDEKFRNVNLLYIEYMEDPDEDQKGTV